MEVLQPESVGALSQWTNNGAHLWFVLDYPEMALGGDYKASRFLIWQPVDRED